VAISPVGAWSKVGRPTNTTMKIFRRPVVLHDVPMLAALFTTSTVLWMAFGISVEALQLSMMASSSNSSNSQRSIFRPPSFIPPPPPGAADITSTLISQLAIIAVKSRLKEEEGVSCDVSFSSSDLLLRGRVGPVTIKGKGWRSARGLSCRALEASVQQCELDASKILSHRKLSLTVPALGKMMVAMNGQDFGNFVTHPLMPPISLEEQTIYFVKDGAQVDAASGTVNFYVKHADVRWTCVLRRSQNPKMAIIEASSDTAEGSGQIGEKLSNRLSRFFNEIVWDLDGTYLSYRDFMVTDKGKAPSVMFSLNIKVEKLPSPSGLDF